MAATYLLAIDQGTTGTTALVLNLEGEVLGKRNVEFAQVFPKPGWVEHEPAALWNSVGEAVTRALADANVDARSIATIGLTNQRETTLLWDRVTGAPLGNAIVWQDRRTADMCAAIKENPASEALVRARTGLLVDAYFSATKVAWMLDADARLRARAERGDLAFGTVDSFLVHKLTCGTAHVTDVTNASRTLLMNLATLAWDDDLLALFRVPRSLLPTIVPSAGHLAVTRNAGFLPDGLPITGIAGDQQAALFGQACFHEGDVKCTYGTGAFVLMNVGSEALRSRHGLVSTVAWQIGGKTTYALEGSAFVAGAAVQWLRDGLGLIRTAAEIEPLARSVASSDGVTFVPALAGLGAPHWDPNARGTITGLTRGTTAAHLARATLEGIALEVWDLVAAMRADAARAVTRLLIDGGGAANDLLAQFQADIADVEVVRPRDIESTARGAAMLAGVGAGLFDQAQAALCVRPGRTFRPIMTLAERTAHLDRWNDALGRTRSTREAPET